MQPNQQQGQEELKKIPRSPIQSPPIHLGYPTRALKIFSQSSLSSSYFSLINLLKE